MFCTVFVLYTVHARIAWDLVTMTYSQVAWKHTSNAFIFYEFFMKFGPHSMETILLLKSVHVCTAYYLPSNHTVIEFTMDNNLSFRNVCKYYFHFLYICLHQILGVSKITSKICYNGCVFFWNTKWSPESTSQYHTKKWMWNKRIKCNIVLNCLSDTIRTMAHPLDVACQSHNNLTHILHVYCVLCMCFCVWKSSKNCWFNQFDVLTLVHGMNRKKFPKKSTHVHINQLFTDSTKYEFWNKLSNRHPPFCLVLFCFALFQFNFTYQ